MCRRAFPSCNETFYCFYRPFYTAYATLLPFLLLHLPRFRFRMYVEKALCSTPHPDQWEFLRHRDPWPSFYQAPFSFIFVNRPESRRENWIWTTFLKESWLSWRTPDVEKQFCYIFHLEDCLLLEDKILIYGCFLLGSLHLLSGVWWGLYLIIITFSSIWVASASSVAKFLLSIKVIFYLLIFRVFILKGIFPGSSIIPYHCINRLWSSHVFFFILDALFAWFTSL